MTQWGNNCRDSRTCSWGPVSREFQGAKLSAFQFCSKAPKPCRWDPASGVPVVQSFPTNLFPGDGVIRPEVPRDEEPAGPPFRTRLIDNNCGFCNTNKIDQRGLPPHVLADVEGKIVCPVLRAYFCPCCGKNGDEAHVIQECPRFPEVMLRSSGSEWVRRECLPH